MRRRPQLSQAIGNRVRIRIGLGATFSPRIFAADDLNGSLIGADRLCGAPTRRELSLRADSVHSHRRRLIVDRNVVAPLYETRPTLPRNVCLAEAEKLAAAGIFDRVEIRRSHGIRNSGDTRSLLRAAYNRHRDRNAGNNSSEHIPTSFTKGISVKTCRLLVRCPTMAAYVVQTANPKTSSTPEVHARAPARSGVCPCP